MFTDDAASVCVLFFSSPMGLEDERQAFRDAAHELTDRGALRSGLVFIPTGWEHVVPGIGRPQERINNHLAKAHALLLVLHDRWGSSSGVGGYSSGTVEELALAMDFLSDAERPMREIVVLFKDVAERQRRDPGPQLRQVLSFRDALDECHELQYGNFGTIEEFKSHLRQLLYEWTVAFQEERAKKPIFLPSLKRWLRTQRKELRSTTRTLKSSAPSDESVQVSKKLVPAPSSIGPALLSPRHLPAGSISLRWRSVAVAALLVTNLGMAALMSTQYFRHQEDQEVQISTPIVELMPAGEISRGPEGTNDSNVPREATRIMLEPAIVGIPLFSSYRVEVRAGKKLVTETSALDRRALDELNITLSSSLLPSGPVSLFLYGRNGTQEKLIQQFDATIAYK